MTIEEAIQYAEKKIDSASYRLEMVYLNNGLRQIVSNEYEFFMQALSAIRQQEHFREVAKKVEPLTLDELRQMDGEPVYCVEITGREEWLFRRDGGFSDMYGEFTSDDFMVWDNYGKLWWCYRQKPEEGTV